MPVTETILPDHILSAVLTLAKREQAKHGKNVSRLAFRSHDFQLQEIFSGLQRSGEYPILNAFVFSDSGPEPYSPALSESVSRLQLSGLIGRENPDYEIVFLRPAAERYFDDILQKKFSQYEINQLRDVATQFLKLVELKA
jgi:hypothetical protein